MAEKYILIDGVRCAFTDERNVLEVARNNGIDIPSLCYCESLSIYKACRLCIVEDENGKIVTSCSVVPEEGKAYFTNTATVQKDRRMILELLLGSHRIECTTCDKAADCKLLEYSVKYRANAPRSGNVYSRAPIDDSSVCLTRDPSKCILCGQCVRMCDEVQGIKALQFYQRSSHSFIAPVNNKLIGATNCVGCGQCVSVCPTGALTVHSNIHDMWKMIHSRYKTVVQVAPAVRVGIGEAFGLPAGEPVMGKIVTALKRLGVDVVYDTNMAADLTIMEEAHEFIDRLNNGGPLPLYTSCCPGWIRNAENKHPALLPNISSCGSPMEMMGALIRKQFKGERVHSIAIMPCTAKKYEATRDQLDKDGQPVVDLVLTTVELIRMIKEANIDFANLPDTECDNPLGAFTGAGVIFGVTGGVTEAVIRHVLNDASPEAMKTIAECGVRGLEGTKIFEVSAGDLTIRIAVVSGLKNADMLIAKIKAGAVKVDFVEVMACPNGCISGGGQPPATRKIKEKRNRGLFMADDACELKISDHNPALDYVYNELLEGRAHDLLHVDYVNQ